MRSAYSSGGDVLFKCRGTLSAKLATSRGSRRFEAPVSVPTLLGNTTANEATAEPDGQPKEDARQCHHRRPPVLPGVVSVGVTA